MAGGQERILRRRIKSVESTKKITRAMELIAATRVVKAQDRAAAARPYSERDHRGDPRPASGPAPPRTTRCCATTPTPRTAAFVVITSDRGLCGAYNSTRHPHRRARAIASAEADGPRHTR